MSMLPRLPMRHATPEEGRLANPLADWRITRREVQRAIKLPDSLPDAPCLAQAERPHKAWRCLGDIAVDALYEAARVMTHPAFG